MTVFYGPWRVKVVDVEPSLPQRFVVKGSAGADGYYPVSAGQIFEIRVDGARWEIFIEQRSYITDVGATHPLPDSWQSTDVLKRQMKIVRPGPGLTVTLDTHRHQFGYDLGVTLECVCDDPKVNPVVPPNPFNFSYKLQ